MLQNTEHVAEKTKDTMVKAKETKTEKQFYEIFE